MTCIVCRRPIEASRHRAQLDTCMSCGDVLAARALQVKRSQVGQAYNKGGLTYLGGSRQAMLDAGRKTSAVVVDTIPQAAPRRSVKKPRRVQVGIWFDANGDKRVWFAGDDPDSMGATRKVFFGEVS